MDTGRDEWSPGSCRLRMVEAALGRVCRNVRCGGKSLAECQRLRRLNLHFNNRQVSGLITVVFRAEISRLIKQLTYGKLFGFFFEKQLIIFLWKQLLKCENFMFFFVVFDVKLNIFGFQAVC